MAFFATDNYSDGYQPEVPMPDVKPPKCGSAESSSAADKANIELLDELYDKNAKLRKKLKKIRKEKTRWKKKYLELYNYVKKMEKDLAIDRIRAEFGLPPLKPLNEDGLKPIKTK